MPLEWNDDYKVDHAEMDAQHRQLFIRVNDFLGAKDMCTCTTGRGLPAALAGAHK